MSTDLFISLTWLWLILVAALMIIPRFRPPRREGKQVHYSKKENWTQEGIFWGSGAIFAVIFLAKRYFFQNENLGYLSLAFFTTTISATFLYLVWLWKKKRVLDLPLRMGGHRYWKSSEPEMYQLLWWGWFVVSMMLMMGSITFAVMVLIQIGMK